VSKTTDPRKGLSAISAHFVGDFNLDESLTKTLAEFGVLASADRAYLYRIHHKAKLAHVTHEWLNADVAGLKGSITSFGLEDFKWLTGQMKKRETLLVKSLTELPSAAKNERTALGSQNVKSFILIPLYIKSRLEGYIGCDYVSGTCRLGQDRLELLKVAVDIVGFSFERKLNESSLRKSRWLNENIFEHSGAATLIIRPDTGISMVNSEFELLSGYTRKELIGRMRFIDLVGADSRQTFMRSHHQMISNAGTSLRNFEFELLTREGKSRTGLMTGASLLESDGCLLSFIDISKFRETEKQLILARDRAEESDRLKSAFLANVSHEIRTPLTTITGFSALLANPALQPDKKEKYITEILKSGNELTTLIDNVIDLSRIDAGIMVPEVSEFKLYPVLEEILNYYMQYLRHHEMDKLEIRLNIPVGSKKLMLRTDRKRLRQILLNLLNNSLKFTPSGSVEFGYTVEDSKGNAEAGDWFRFYVRDSGIGISNKDRDKIFERFFKIHQKGDRLYPGAGLGLAVAKDLVTLLGGKIWVESRPGKGSTFFFSIPNSVPVHAVNGTEQPLRREKDDLSERTILIAEDTESNFLYIEEILESMNVRVIHAVNGAEAIELVDAHKDEIDLIFMDILMPEYDGFEATREIRKIRKDIPVIAQTAFTFEGELINGLYAGCFDDYILKPYSVNSIRDLVRKYCPPRKQVTPHKGPRQAE
jgi:PAS domain S-box-containing protein